MRVDQFQKRAKRACPLLDLPEPELLDLKDGSLILSATEVGPLLGGHSVVAVPPASIPA